jgi:quinol monooxygenase YgiN
MRTRLAADLGIRDIQVYKTDEAPAEHKATAHYTTWAETVADMMAEPRTNTKYHSYYPFDVGMWDSHRE